MQLVSVNLIQEDKLKFLPLAIVPSNIFISKNFVNTYLSAYFQCKVDEFKIVTPGRKLIYVGDDTEQYLIDEKFNLNKKYLLNREYVFYNHVSNEGVLVFSNNVDAQFALMPKDLMIQS